jgi:DNA-binding IclR family transcriptional regulator
MMTENLLPQTSPKKRRKLGATTKKEDPYFSRAAGKALELLDLVGRSEMPLTLNELVQQIRLTKSSTFRLLHTLESLHHLRRDEQGRYQRLDNLRSTSLQKLQEAAAEPMRRLSMEFRETVSLAALMGNRIEVVAVIDSPHLIRMSNVAGRILPPHASSMGKAIAAFQTAEVRERLLVSYGTTVFTHNTITDQRKLEEYFEKIRATGNSCDDEENTLDGFCYGAPIVLPGNRVNAAISVSMPKTRLPQEAADRKRIVDALHKAAKDIAEALD